jgi:Rrf2 family iron-sulfur cluster assembly transcriptional regulator
MSLLLRKGILAIVVVIDIALHAGGRPVLSRELSRRHRLPPRHLETVLQALVHRGILRSIKGPRGGYKIARQHSRITVDDILRAVGTAVDLKDGPLADSALLGQVVMPALIQAEQTFSATLARINVEMLLRSAEDLGLRTDLATDTRVAGQQKD